VGQALSPANHRNPVIIPTLLLKNNGTFVSIQFFLIFTHIH
jgi:hypothetical protein